MQRQKVESSNIVSIGYDKTNKILEIEFKEGRLYQFSGVEEDVANDLINAPSHGKYFHAKIREKYPTKRLA